MIFEEFKNFQKVLAYYTRSDLTDDLHNKFGFRTDYETLKEKSIYMFREFDSCMTSQTI